MCLSKTILLPSLVGVSLDCEMQKTEQETENVNVVLNPNRFNLKILDIVLVPV